MLSHRGSSTRLYRVWVEMRRRCKRDCKAKYYRDRGITVCESWERSFDAFRSWAISSGYVEGLSIDRIDGDKGYCPSNCRWANKSQQSANTRSHADSTSKYKGVCWDKRTNSWRADIGLLGNVVNLGRFASEEEAALAYDREAIKLHGEYAFLNFKQEQYQ